MEFSRKIKEFPVRISAALTDSYVAGTVIGSAAEYNFLGLAVDFTLGASTSMELKIEVSENGTNYYQQIAESTTGGTTTATLSTYQVTASGSYSFVVKPVRAKTIRVSVKGTGTPAVSTCAIKGYLAWA